MFMALLAAASLSGCAVYPLPLHRGYARPVVVEQPAPVYVTPAPVYVTPAPAPAYPRGYRHGGRYDRDGNGVPDYREGDGGRGRYDR
jgi:hypothetical protein